MGDHRGRIDEIVREALQLDADPASLIIVIRRALRAEHDEGWDEGHADGMRDAAWADRIARERGRLTEAAITEATEMEGSG